MTENLIFYYSGTGNSLVVARELADRLGGTTLLPVLAMKDDYLVASEVRTVGFIYPIYMNAIPWLVRSFLRKIKLQKDCYVYAIATHGGIPGKAGCHVHKVLKGAGIDLDGYFEITMINNTPKGVAPKPFMTLDWEKDITEEKVTLMMKQWKEQLPEIAASIEARDTGALKELQENEHGMKYAMMKLLWRINEQSKPKLNFILEEGCTGCGICEKVCTMNRIKLVDGKPSWEGNECSFCYACFNYCPNQAIAVKHYTKKLGRYHYPDIGWKDIAAQKQTSN